MADGRRGGFVFGGFGNQAMRPSGARVRAQLVNTAGVLIERPEPVDAWRGFVRRLILHFLLLLLIATHPPLFLAL